MPKMQEQYAEEYSRKADTFSALAQLTAPHANTDNDRYMVAVAQGLAEVCRMLAKACKEDAMEAESVE